MKTSGDKNFLTQHLIQMLRSEQNVTRFQNAPNLLPYNGTNLSGLFNKVTSSFVYTIVEAENSTLGAEVLLDFHYAKDFVVIKSVNSTSTLLTLLDVTQIPSLLVIFKDLSVVPITPRLKTKESFKHAVKVFYESKGLLFPKEPELVGFNEDLLSKEINEFDAMLDNIVKGGDAVYLVDLENALHYSLKNEIPAVKFINGSKHEALVNFLNVLIKYFPIKSGYLMDLKQYVVASG